jgi:hypothetical protein
MDLFEIGLWWNGVDSSGQTPVAAPCEHGNELSNSRTCWEILLYDCFSRRAQLHGVR